jgi:hypothetical protein
MVLRWIGVLAGAISLVALFQAATGAPSFSPLLRVLIAYDFEWKRIALHWLEPALRTGVAMLRGWTGWRLELQDHWRHVFLLLFLYFGAGARLAWRQQDAAGVAVRVIVGLATAVLASVAFAVASPGDAAASIAGALFPVGAIVVYALVVSAWVAARYKDDGPTWPARFFGNAGGYPLIYASGGAAIVLLALAMNAAGLLPRARAPGVAVLLVLICVLALFLRWSERRAQLKDNIGVLMLETIGAAAAAVLSDGSWGLMA